jgi:hypothetical protein
MRLGACSDTGNERIPSKFPPPGPFQLEAAGDRSEPSAVFVHQETISGVNTFSYGKNFKILSF